MVLKVVLEGLPAVDDGVPGGAPHGEGVADDGPLRLVVEGHDLAQVVDEAGQLKPLLVRVLLADALGRLRGLCEILASSSQICVQVEFAPEMHARCSAKRCPGPIRPRGH